MIRQYFAYRRRGGCNPLGVGVIPVGAIFYIQDEGWWRDRYRGAAICRNPWIVEAFLNGALAAARRDPKTGMWQDLYLAGRSDTALVRSLRDGRRHSIAVRVLILHEEHGLAAQSYAYPDLPNTPLYRLGARPYGVGIEATGIGRAREVVQTIGGVDHATDLCGLAGAAGDFAR